MALYARSDVMAVAVSPAHGGCGRTHRRPARDGATAILWSLACEGGCEDVLRRDPQWASEISGVPETPDEARVREEREKLGAREQTEATAAALQRLGQLGDLPGVLSALLDYVASQEVQARRQPVSAAEAVPAEVNSAQGRDKHPADRAGDDSEDDQPWRRRQPPLSTGSTGSSRLRRWSGGRYPGGGTP
ncbi:hypothetical protein ACFYN3_31035 [Streptomyces lavendulae]|uniref:hypothetical protein n=1 Tax=Streptomyces lavendulae TaxID=1914 RepID=UPI0036B492DA